MRSKHFLAVVALAIVSAIVVSVAAASPPATNPLFPTGTTLKAFPKGAVTVKIQIGDTSKDGEKTPFWIAIANRTGEPLPYTKTGIAVDLDGMYGKWVQTSDITGGFGYQDSGGWFIRTGTIRKDQVIMVTGFLTMPDRGKFSKHDPRRDATVACATAKTQDTIPGMPRSEWHVYTSERKLHTCSQYAAS